MRLINEQRSVYVKSETPTSSVLDLFDEIDSHFRSERPSSTQKKVKLRDVGALVKYIREARTLSREQVVDKMKIGRRKKRLAWLEKLEETGRARTNVFDDICSALEVPEKIQQTWQAYFATKNAQSKRVSMHSRVLGNEQEIFRCNFSNLLSLENEYFEREALADKLGVLVENHEMFMSDHRYRSALLGSAYLVNDVRPKHSEHIEATSEMTLEPIPLGLLVHLWAQETGVLELPDLTEPFHIVRVIGDKCLSHFWVEGILRRTRKWKQVWVPQDELVRFMQEVEELRFEYFAEQKRKLWWNFRKFSSFQHAWETSQMLASRGVNNSEWARALRLPSWINKDSLPELRQTWEETVETLGALCRKPLFDDYWSEESPEYDWICQASPEKWVRWRKGVSAGVNDYRGRRWTEEAFEKAVNGSTAGTVEVPCLIEILAEMGDERYLRALQESRRNKSNDSLTGQRSPLNVSIKNTTTEKGA
ncbi:MAG: hypothetical protein VYC39_20040 [Myxococcota bacterium]|nr:hypothetical protein [Myxococcota bacterium]